MSKIDKMIAPQEKLFRQKVLLCLILAAVTLGLFWQVGGHDFINYDDESYVTENPRVQAGFTRESLLWAFSTNHAANWHPVTWLSHLADVEMHGLQPGGHHLNNLFLHVACAILLFLVLSRISAAFWPSALVAALFAMHPLHVESVAWVAERKDVLSGLFFMLTLLFYLRYLERPGALRYLLALLLFALGLMSKPMLVTLPCVLLLLDYWPLGRLAGAPAASPPGLAPLPQRSLLQLIREKIPFFALALVASVVTVLAQQKGGAVVSAQSLPLSFRLGNALLSYFQYLRKMVWPSDLAIIYPIDPGLSPTAVLGAALFLALVSFCTLKQARRHPYLAVGWLWYLGTLVPVIGLVQVGQQALADRYSYLPLIGLFIMVAFGGAALVRGRRSRLALTLAACTALCSLALATWQYLGAWQNSVTLFSRAVQVVPGNYVGLAALGNALRSKGQTGAAIACYREAQRIKPDYDEAYSGMGFALAAQGRFDEAIAQYQAALRLNPGSANTSNNLGIALAQRGRNEEAVASFRGALQLEPGLYDALMNLGDALLQLNRPGEAIPHYQAALAVVQGRSAEVPYALGLCYAMTGELAAAVHHFREAVRLQPGFAQAHYNLGVAFARTGALDLAAEQFDRALRIDPALVQARKGLQALQGRKRSAPKVDASHSSAGRELRPSQAPASGGLS